MLHFIMFNYIPGSGLINKFKPRIWYISRRDRTIKKKGKGGFDLGSKSKKREEIWNMPGVG